LVRGEALRAWCCGPVRKAFFVLILVRADSRWFAVTHR